MKRKILALIAARSGSKGLRHKNIQPLLGTPLLVRAIELAKASRHRDEDWRIIVSTDSSHYRRLALDAGAEVPSLRPKELSRDDTRLIDVVLHTLTTLDDPFDAVVLLSATTPLTTPRDVRAALTLYYRGGGPSVVSVARERTHPSWRFSLQNGQLVVPRKWRVARRQTAPLEVTLNGAIYIAHPRWLARHRQFVAKGTLAYTMPPERTLDIETKHDLDQAKRVLESPGE